MTLDRQGYTSEHIAEKLGEARIAAKSGDDAGVVRVRSWFWANLGVQGRDWFDEQMEGR